MESKYLDNSLLSRKQAWDDLGRIRKSSRCQGNIVANEYSEDPNSLYLRANSEFEVGNDWEYSVLSEDMKTYIAFEDEDENPGTKSLGRPRWNFSVGIRFPKIDLSEIMKKLEEFNSEK